MRNITTPQGNHVVVLKDFITGREMRVLRHALLNAANTSDGELKGINPDAIDDAEDAALRAVVISVDANTEGIIKTVLEMSAMDYEFIVAEVNKVTSPVSEKK